MIDFLIDLLNKKSISPLDQGCQNIIYDKLKGMGFVCYKLNKYKTNNLWAIYGNSNPIFCFCGHTDVVSSVNIKKWKYNPFEGIKKKKSYMEEELQT